MVHCQIITFGTPSFDEALHLRKIVLRDSLNITFLERDIEQEWNQIHVGLYSTLMSLIGVATIVPLGDSYAKVRQFAIHPDMQNKGFGRQLNQYIEEVALLNKITHIVLHARESAVSFYEKNKYKKTDHPKFIEVGIPHFRMCKKLL